MNKWIIVPTNKAAQKALDIDEASDDQLFQLKLSGPEFRALWQTGIFDEINRLAGVNIDDFEDESITDTAALHQIVTSNIFGENPLQQAIKDLCTKAITCNTGIYFYF
jgi:hypothetical protein